MRAVIHQPDFMPYLGFFHRLLYCDQFILLDQVQFVRGSKEAWQYRDKIKGPQGESWITVGVEKTNLGAKINEVPLRKDNSWRERMRQQIQQYYNKAEYFKQIWPYCEEIILFKTEKMADYNWNSIRILMKLFDITVETKWASHLQPSGKSNELVVDILKKISADVYLSGVGAKAYHEDSLYNEANIEVYWQKFEHPKYRQLYDGFIPYLSSIDLLFNCGIEDSRQIIRNCGIFQKITGEVLR